MDPDGPTNVTEHLLKHMIANVEWSPGDAELLRTLAPDFSDPEADPETFVPQPPDFSALWAAKDAAASAPKPADKAAEAPKAEAPKVRRLRVMEIGFPALQRIRRLEICWLE